MKSSRSLPFLPILLSGCSLLPQAGSNKPRAEQEDDIREAILRYQLGGPNLQAHTDAGAFPTSGTPTAGDVGHKMYFLSVGDGKDPSDELLSRFQNLDVPVKKVSESYRDEKGALCCQVKEKSSGLLGLIYSVSSIQWIDNNTVSTESGYFGGGLFARSDTYKLVRQGAQRKVEHIKYGPVA